MAFGSASSYSGKIQIVTTSEVFVIQDCSTQLEDFGGGTMLLIKNNDGSKKLLCISKDQIVSVRFIS